MNPAVATHVLGLPPGAPGRDELVSAWRRFARTHHPDRCPGDPGAAWRFATGREAFETLIDRVIDRPPAAGAAQGCGCAGILRGREAGRAIPYEMRPLHTREWRA